MSGGSFGRYVSGGRGEIGRDGDGAPDGRGHRVPAAWNRHDSKALAALFGEHAEFVSVVGARWRHRAEIEAGYRRMFATIFRTSQLDGQVASARRLRPDVATVHLAWELTGQAAPDGSAMAPRKGILLLVLSEEGRGWHIQVAQATESLPGVLGPSTPDQPS